MSFPTTPSQTVGPFFTIGLHWADGPYVASPETPNGFWIRGRVIDGSGEAVSDALVESWQADPNGQFGLASDQHAEVRWRGFGRSETTEGEWAIYTVKPGRLPGTAHALQAPHLNVSVFARGLLDRVITRIYFSDEVEANEEDEVLSSLPHAARETLIACPTPGGYRHDIVLQGAHETVFFDL